MSAAVLSLQPRNEADLTIAKLEQASARLSEVRTIQDAKEIHDVVKAAGVYAREHKLGIDVIRKARAVTYTALRRIGELLTHTDRAVGGQPYQATGSGSGPVATLAELGIDKKVSGRAQQLFRLPMETFERIRDGWTTLDKVLAEEKEAARAAKDAAWREFLSRVNAARAAIPEHENLQVYRRNDLFALGIQADAVITEPPAAAGQLQVFSDLALACANVPVVIVCLGPSSLVFLPDILRRLCAHLTYRGGGICDMDLLLAFSPEGRPIHKVRPPRGAHFNNERRWARYCVDRFTDEGDLIVDPFMTGLTARAAVENCRRFIGGSDGDDLPACLRDLTPDDSDPIGTHDEEATGVEP